jgi:hypothetical protein
LVERWSDTSKKADYYEFFSKKELDLRDLAMISLAFYIIAAAYECYSYSSFHSSSLRAFL